MPFMRYIIIPANLIPSMFCLALVLFFAFLFDYPTNGYDIQSAALHYANVFFHFDSNPYFDQTGLLIHKSLGMIPIPSSLTHS
jgi:hypothetical protein